MARTTALQTDYLVVGAGALGMAFVDTLIDRSDADVVIVDRQHRPGGHWLASYPFVQLHQPSRFYGVDSTPLGTDRMVPEGTEQFMERSTGTEICAYYNQVMRDRFLTTGRVRFSPMCDYLGDRTFRSRVTGDVTEVEVRRRVVDTTYAGPDVPARTPAPFAVDDGARCVPVGELADIDEAPSGYVIVGGGKTGADAICWLLDRGTAPDDITWIRPRDSWYLNRTFFQPGHPRTLSAVVAQLEAMIECDSMEGLLARMEEGGEVLRTDRSVVPTMMRGATISRVELEQLVSVEHVVRQGHVQRIEPGRIVLDGGTVDVPRGALHVHCAARGLSSNPPRPIFTEDTVTPQMVTRVAACLSAGLVGFLEATELSVEEKNALAPATGQPNTPFDFVRAISVGLRTEMSWLGGAPDLFEWVDGSRLNLLSGLPEHDDTIDVDALQGRFLTAAGPALERLDVFAAQATPQEQALMGQPPAAVAT